MIRRKEQGRGPEISHSSTQCPATNWEAQTHGVPPPFIFSNVSSPTCFGGAQSTRELRGSRRTTIYESSARSTTWDAWINSRQMLEDPSPVLLEPRLLLQEHTAPSSPSPPVPKFYPHSPRVIYWRLALLHLLLSTLLLNCARTTALCETTWGTNLVSQSCGIT